MRTKRIECPECSALFSISLDEHQKPPSKEARKAFKMVEIYDYPQAKVARLFGVHQSTVSRWIQEVEEFYGA